MTSEDLIAIINFLDKRDAERRKELDAKEEYLHEMLVGIELDLGLIKNELGIEDDYEDEEELGFWNKCLEKWTKWVGPQFKRFTFFFKK